MDASVKQYIAGVVDATRHAAEILPEDLAGYVRMGASPRASIAFMKMGKAVALLNRRTYVIPEDIRLVSHQVLRHRLQLSFSAAADNVEVETIIDRLTAAVKTP